MQTATAFWASVTSTWPSPASTFRRWHLWRKSTSTPRAWPIASPWSPTTSSRTICPSPHAPCLAHMREGAAPEGTAPLPRTDRGRPSEPHARSRV